MQFKLPDLMVIMLASRNAFVQTKSQPGNLKHKTWRISKSPLWN